MFIYVYSAKLEDPKNISILETRGGTLASLSGIPAKWLSEDALLLRSWALRIL